MGKEGWRVGWVNGKGSTAEVVVVVSGGGDGGDGGGGGFFAFYCLLSARE